MKWSVNNQFHKKWIICLRIRNYQIYKNKVIKNALYKKFGKPAYVISGFENDSYSDIDTDDLKIGFNIISYAGGKIIIEKLSEESVRPRVDLPVS